MTDIERPWTAEEVAEAARVSVWTVGKWTRTGILPRLPGRAIRIPAAAVRKLLLEGYDDRHVQSNGQATRQATASRVRDSDKAHRPLPGPPVGSAGAVPRQRGPSAGDVVVRRVTG